MRTEIRAAWNRSDAAKQNALLFSSDRLVSMLKPPFRFYHFGSTYLNLESAKKVTSARKYSRSDRSRLQQEPSLNSSRNIEIDFSIYEAEKAV